MDLGRVSKSPSAIAGPDAVPDATAETPKDNQYSLRPGGDARNRTTESRFRPPAGADSHRTGTPRHDLVVTRVFDAPVERVWQAWTDSADVQAWWGPEGFTAPIAEMNVREGGTSRVCMRSPDGHDFHNTWTYERVIPLRRLEFLMGFADADWNPKTPAELGLPPDIPAEVRHVVTFSAAGQKTELTVTEFGYTAPQTVEISKLGLEQCLDKMALRVRL